MKKFIIILAISMLGITANAQWGVKGGANFAMLTGDDADGLKTLVGFYGGVYDNFKINDMFSFQPELVFSGQGAKIEDSDGARIKLNYLNLSPLFRYNSNGFFAGTGPQIGFLLSAHVKDDNTSVDFKDNVKSTDFAWAFMVGYEMPSGLGFYGRYNLGLANIAEDGDIKNSVFQLGLRYSFLKPR